MITFIGRVAVGAVDGMTERRTETTRGARSRARGRETRGGAWRRARRQWRTDLTRQLSSAFPDSDPPVQFDRPKKPRVPNR
jgi:hypothetical protein